MGGTTNVSVKTDENVKPDVQANAQATATVTAQAQVNPAPVQAPQQINYEQFRTVEMLVGEVKAVEPVPNADKLVKLFVDFGDRGSKVVLAGIAKSFPDTSVLVGKRYAFVHNLEPRKMRGIESQGMILAAPTSSDPDKVSLVEVPGAKVGARLT